MQKTTGIVTLDTVKRIVYIALMALGIGGMVWAFFHRSELGLTASHTLGTSASALSELSASTSTGHPARITWQKLDRPEDGFKVELPEDPKQLQVQSFNESGAPEPVNMIFSSPDGSTTFAVAWADNPPVMRSNNDTPDPTLDMARDGALARTQTALVNEIRNTPQGFPGRDLVARNVGGGILDSRLIVAGQRLYMLIAAYPSMGARREQDVTRFFNSFRVTEPARIPETLPPAPAPGKQE